MVDKCRVGTDSDGKGGCFSDSGGSGGRGDDG